MVEESVFAIMRLEQRYHVRVKCVVAVADSLQRDFPIADLQFADFLEDLERALPTCGVHKTEMIADPQLNPGIDTPAVS